MGFLRRVHGVTKGRTEVRYRPGPETILAPPCSNLKSFGSKCSALQKKLATLLGLFGAWGIVLLLVASGVTLCNKVRSCEISRALNVEPLLRNDRSQLR